MPLLLASTSPRRKDLLALLRIPFEVADPSFVERLRRDLTPEEQAKQFAAGKARSCAAQYPTRLVLGSDTLIALDGSVLGKPADLAEARAMLRTLRGREHLIHTAVALCRQDEPGEAIGCETVRVWMKPFSEQELTAYLATGEGLDKAGAYSIQGRGGDLIERILGDYTAAVGLPLRLTAELLRKAGLAIPADVAELYRTKPYPNWGTFEG